MMLPGNKYLPVFLLLLLVSAVLHAQEPVKVTRSDNKVVLEGKVYYVHVVKPGQTLYSIAKAYNVSEKEIMIENPGSSADLIIGQVLKIPYDPSSAFDVDTQKEQQGRKKHVLQEGETIYAVSRKYKVSVEDLLALNPGLDINDLPVGQVIMLPGGEEQKNELSYNEEGYILHKVKKGETLYSLSRYYDVSVREIRALNPELGWGGPRSGDVIKVPQPKTTVAEVFTPDTIVVDTVPVGEADTIAEETYIYEELENLVPERGRMYSVAYLIPFDYQEMEPLDSLLKDVRSPLRRERIREDYMIEKATPKSINFLEFLEGSMLAADTLTDAGMKLDIRVYDTKRSMYRMRQILEDPAMKKMDLIIGPFYSFNLELVSEFAREHQIPVVTPFHSGDSLLMDNPYLFQPSPSFQTEYRKSAEYIARSYDSNLVLVHDGDSAKLPMINYYKQVIFDELEKYAALDMVTFKEVIIEDVNTDELIHSLSPDEKNLLILPATDEAFASQVATRLYYERDNYDIEVFGSSYWVGFDDIEITYIHALELTIAHTHWYDYSDPEFLRLLKKFRQNFLKEPGSYTRRGYNFGIAGYDLSLYFMSALREEGRRFILDIDSFKADGTYSDYRFDRVSRKGGYENEALHYYHFGDSLQVTEVQLPEKPPVHLYLRPAGDDPFYYRWFRQEPDSLEIKDR